MALAIFSRVESLGLHVPLTTSLMQEVDSPDLSAIWSMVKCLVMSALSAVLLTMKSMVFSLVAVVCLIYSFQIPVSAICSQHREGSHDEYYRYGVCNKSIQPMGTASKPRYCTNALLLEN